MPTSIENYGSTARDYCMLERNFLSHAKLALLLMLISSSVLLHARLDSPTNPEERGSHKLGISLAAIEIIAAFVVIGLGLWEYESGIRDMRVRRAFLLSSQPHFVVVAVIAVTVFVTCVIFLVNKGV
ncbi:hypothetical protein V8E53_005000 [Lactarius tabidus]